MNGKFTDMKICTCAKLFQSCPTLCDPVDCSQPGSSVHGILQARILECIAVPPPRDLPNPGIKPTSLTSPALASRFFTTRTTREAHENLSTQFMKSEKKVLVAQSCLTL